MKIFFHEINFVEIFKNLVNFGEFLNKSYSFLRGYITSKKSRTLGFKSQKSKKSKKFKNPENPKNPIKSQKFLNIFLKIRENTKRIPKIPDQNQGIRKF